jgi:hypothetical protein
MRHVVFAALLAAALCGCRERVDAGGPSAGASATTAVPKTISKEPAMIIESSADRLPPPEVPPVERDGVRYAQAADGHAVGAKQVGGVLVATDIATGKQLWTLAVYGNPVDAKLEADVQWVFFSAMTFGADGHLHIVNEAGKKFVVDVKARSVAPGA